jgi:hypothetical protein
MMPTVSSHANRREVGKYGGPDFGLTLEVRVSIADMAGSYCEYGIPYKCEA